MRIVQFMELPQYMINLYISKHLLISDYNLKVKFDGQNVIFVLLRSIWKNIIYEKEN